MTKVPSFRSLLDAKKADAWLGKVISVHTSKSQIFKRWYQQTGEAGEIYPSQGLLKTPYDYLEHLGKTLMGEEELWDTLKTRRYILELCNHPARIKALELAEEQPFVAPQKVTSNVMDYASNIGLALAIGDLGCAVEGTQKPRVSRRDLLQQGPFIKLGKKARIPFAGGAMPDVFGAPAALATMAMCHALVCIPRNGLFSNITWQTDLAKATLDWMKSEPLLENHRSPGKLLKRWQANLVGVIETELDTALKRAESLYQVGVRAFRIYSPEPGSDAIGTLAAMRKQFGSEVELFVGQVASTDQAVRFQEAGADGLYLGIGGGGRCITAVRSSSVVDWPGMLWQLRGLVTIPIIVEGGASDHIGTTLLLGASAIGVSRAVAGGTIESPGGLLYWVDSQGNWFKPYGGEASARTKFLDNKMLGMGIPAFVEGETTKARKNYLPYAKPSITAHMYFLLEDVVLSLVFRGARSVSELQNINPSPLRWITPGGGAQQGTH